MATSRSWRPSQVLDGPRPARFEDIEELNEVFSESFTDRYRRDGLTEDQLNTMNQELLMRLQEEGLAVPSGTMLRGKFAIRCAITNHRSRREDFEALVEAVVRLGGEVT